MSDEQKKTTLGTKHISSVDIMRQVCQEMDMPIQQAVQMDNIWRREMISALKKGYFFNMIHILSMKVIRTKERVVNIPGNSGKTGKMVVPPKLRLSVKTKDRFSALMEKLYEGDSKKEEGYGNRGQHGDAGGSVLPG